MVAKILKKLLHCVLALLFLKGEFILLYWHLLCARSHRMIGKTDIKSSNDRLTYSDLSSRHKLEVVGTQRKSCVH